MNLELAESFAKPKQTPQTETITSSKDKSIQEHKPPSWYKDYVPHIVTLNKLTSYKAVLCPMIVNPEK
jgi:hypothetical protein